MNFSPERAKQLQRIKENFKEFKFDHDIENKNERHNNKGGNV